LQYPVRKKRRTDVHMADSRNSLPLNLWRYRVAKKY